MKLKTVFIKYNNTVKIENDNQNIETKHTYIPYSTLKVFKKNTKNF